MKKDEGKIVFYTKEGRFGNFVVIRDYTEFEKESLNSEELKSKNKFYSSKIFFDKLVNNNYKKFWGVISNFECCFNKKEVAEHFDKKIKDLEEELLLWKKYKTEYLEKADEYLEGFDDLKKSTNFFDYL